MSHTPGPWDKILHEDTCSRVGAKTLIAIVYSETFKDRENQEANARLIAAAPELLEALRSIAFWVPTVCYEHDERRYVDIEEVFKLKRIAADARDAAQATPARKDGLTE